MDIAKKISSKNNDLLGQKPITIAFLGDSVTQGCFECYFDNDGKIQTVFDYANSYPVKVREVLNLLYPSAQINIINSGVSGDSAPSGVARFDRDIAPYKPDLVVLSFGLNDACAGKDYVENYTNALKTLFEKTKDLGAECIFIFQNMMNTKVSPHLRDEREKDLAKYFAEIQNAGVVEFYCEKARETAQECGVDFVDIYSVWKKMYENGVDTTELLSNKYNHPIRQFNLYTAIKIVEKIFE